MWLPDMEVGALLQAASEDSGVERQWSATTGAQLRGSSFPRRKLGTSRRPKRRGGGVEDGARWLRGYTSGYVSASEVSETGRGSKGPLLWNEDTEVSYEAPKSES